MRILNAARGDLAIVGILATLTLTLAFAIALLAIAVGP